MAIPSREQLDHDAAIDYLKQGCQRVNSSKIKDEYVLPSLSHQYYTSQSHLHDLARFATDITSRYRKMSEKKLIAGLSYGVFAIRKSSIPYRNFRIITESMTIPDLCLEERIYAFNKLAYNDSIYEIREEFPWPDNPELYGKDYELGLRSMLAAGYLVKKEMTEEINAEEIKLWFNEAYDFYHDKETNIDLSQL
jgi:hypothetical protein